MERRLCNVLLFALVIVANMGDANVVDHHSASERYRTPPVAPPHWVPHPTYEVAKEVLKQPETYDFLNNMVDEMGDVAAYWWEKFGKHENPKSRGPLLSALQKAFLDHDGAADMQLGPEVPSAPPPLQHTRVIDRKQRRLPRAVAAAGQDVSTEEMEAVRKTGRVYGCNR